MLSQARAALEEAKTSDEIQAAIEMYEGTPGLEPEEVSAAKARAKEAKRLELNEASLARMGV